MGIISSIINGVKDVAVDKPWQKGFWYEQQEYNSPENQVKRMREAGINPQLAVGNIQSGQGASIAPTNPNVASGITDSIIGIINNKKQQNIMDAEARQKNANAFLEEVDSFTRFAKNIQDLKESLSRENKNKMDTMVQDFLGTAQEQLYKSMTAVNASQNEINWLNYAKGMTELKYLEPMKRLEWIQAVGNIVQTSENINLTREQIKTQIERTTSEYFGWKDKKFQYELNKKTENYLIHDRKMQPQRGHNVFGAFPMLDYEWQRFRGNY